MAPLPQDVPDWARRCPSGKQKFASAADARKIFRTESRRGTYATAFKGTMHVYRCDDCGAFHYKGKARRPDKRKFR